MPKHARLSLRVFEEEGCLKQVQIEGLGDDIFALRAGSRGLEFQIAGKQAVVADENFVLGYISRLAELVSNYILIDRNSNL